MSKTSEIKARTESIKAWFQNAITRTEDPAVRQHIGRALLIVYNNQTSTEQSAKATIEHNGRGFTGANAQFGSSVAEQFMRRNDMSPKQASAMAKLLTRHSRQIAIAALEKSKNSLVSA